MSDSKTPRTDAAEKEYDGWLRSVRHPGSSFRDKRPITNAPDDGWETARSLERDLTACQERLRVAEEDARRYRWLRQQHWSDNKIAVVEFPRDCVMLGTNCPSGRLLDAAIDEAMREGKE
jgi:hypothetical protein